LNFLAITNMDPWPTAKGFVSEFQYQLRQSVLRSIGRLIETPHIHGFVLTDASGAEVFGDHFPVFTEVPHQYHLLVKFAFEDEQVKVQFLQKYRERLATKPPGYHPLSLLNKEGLTLYDLLRAKTFKADLWCGVEFTEPTPPLPLGEANLRVTDVILNYHFDPVAVRPATEKYYIYGVQDKVYASHRIFAYPDYHQTIQLAAAPAGASQSLLDVGFEATLITVAGRGDVNPLKENFGYPIEFLAEEGQVVSSSLVVKKDVWFDTVFLNVSGGHGHAHGKHLYAHKG